MNQRRDTDELIRLRRARDLIDREFARPLDVPAMARAAQSSTSHFARRYREAFGETPYQHLLTRRVERAKALLRASELTITEVCLAVGFSSLGSFSSRFHELTGWNPSGYRPRVAEPGDIPPCMVRGLARSSRNREAGAEVLQEPIEQPYGVLDCAFRDPSGNMVRFSQPLAR